jgi:type I restriction enzyme, S subunit
VKAEIRRTKDEWKRLALDQVASLNPRLPISLLGDDQVSFVPMSAVSADTSDVTEKETRSYEEVSKGYTPFVSGDVLVAKITPCFENGKIALTRLQQKAGFGSTEFHVIRALPDELDPRYLVHFMRQPWIRFAGERRMTGSGGQRRVPENFLAKLEIPLPPLAEQRRIAEVLDRAEALRAKRRAALAELDALTQSLFLDLFGDPSTILERWPTRELGELLDFLTSGSRGWAEYYAESGDLFLRIQNVRRDELVLEDVAYVNAPDTAEAKRTRVQPGDVLLSITADLGRTAAVPEGIGTAFINQHLSILRTKALVPRFLSAYFVSPVGARQVSGRNKHAVKAGLNFDDIRSFLIPVPPLTLQQEFARRVAAVEKLKQAQRTSLAELDALFASLQHRAFRGEL